MKKRHFPLAIMGLFVTVYGVLNFRSFLQIEQRQSQPTEEQVIYRIGGKKFIYDYKHMSSSQNRKQLLPGDDITDLYFTAKIHDDGSVTLLTNEMMISETAFKRYAREEFSGEHLWVRVKVFSGKYLLKKRYIIAFRYGQMLDDTYHSVKKQDNRYGLNWYVQSTKEGKVYPDFIYEYGVNFNKESDDMPSTFLKQTQSILKTQSTPDLKGGVEQFFRLDNKSKLEIKVSYRGIHVQHWKRIENSIKHFFNQLIVGK